MNDLKAEFSKIAANGYLGYPEGEDSYAYMRASSERQVEEGSSFSRQLENISKAAKRDKLRISFDLVFFDDGFTGFEFQHRPSLLKLRHEAKTKPRAGHLVLEDIDRLSRNADWQQGFLLEEFSRHKISIHFYINPGSQLERYVRGYIAQEGMKKDIERMRMGGVYKAMSGKVTAKRRRYGYLRTDPQDTHYILHPEESKVVRWVFEKLIYEGWAATRVAKQLNEDNVPTRYNAKAWCGAIVCQIIKSPVYKGDFYAQRHYQVRTDEYLPNGKPRKTNYLRPIEDWIKIDVPAIVTPEEWQLAQEALERNRKKSTRHDINRRWLLAGFLKCAKCKKYGFIAVWGNTKRNPRRYYGCNSRNSPIARKLNEVCHTPYVWSDEIEKRVWEEIENVIYDPGLIVARLEEKQSEDRKAGYEDQLAFIDRQLSDLEKEKSKYEAAYERDIYTLDEFEEKMKDLRGKAKTANEAKVKLKAKQAESVSIEAQKKLVLSALKKLLEEVERARENKEQPNIIPFEVKRKILTALVDVIWVDSIERKFTIEGEIKGTFNIDDDSDQDDKKKGQFESLSSLRWTRCATCRCAGRIRRWLRGFRCRRR